MAKERGYVRAVGEQINHYTQVYLVKPFVNSHTKLRKMDSANENIIVTTSEPILSKRMIESFANKRKKTQITVRKK